MATAVVPSDNAAPPDGVSKFSFAQARSLISDLTRPNPWIYWCDFLASVLLGHLALFAILTVPRVFPDAAWSWGVAGLCYVVTVLAYTRALMFIHELVHLPQKGWRGFRFAWNALCGIPFFVPSFLYYPHLDHHRRKHYGTQHDGEYVSLSHRGRWMIVGFIIQALAIPLIGFFRFLLISPLCWAFPNLRPIVHRHASTMVIDPFYERQDYSRSLMRTVYLQEALCFVWAIAFIGLWFVRPDGYLATGSWINPMWIVAYAVAVGILTLNEVRTLGAHRWQGEGEEMTFEQQLVDSVNYPNHPVASELWGPVGLRFHGLHHLFPRLPYHNLSIAHRRLVQGLPSDSIYHQTIGESLTDEICKLWNRARESEIREAESTVPSAVDA